MRKQLAAFITAVTAEDSTAFLDAVDNHVTRHQESDLEELLQSASRKDVATICDGLLHQMHLSIAIRDDDDQHYDDDDQNEMQAGLQDLAEMLLHRREASASICMAVAIVSRLILAESKPSPPQTLHDAAVLLHEHGMLFIDYDDVLDEITKLCFEWWVAECPGRETLTPRTVFRLIAVALSSCTAVAVKRCHAMRNALNLFDFDDPSSTELSGLLCRAFMSPPFLRCAEGRRFLAYLLGLQPRLVNELTGILKNQVQAGRKSVLEAYGEILYRAWSSTTGVCLLEIKESCIQNLMEASILASTPALASALRRVLAGFHSQKHQPGVDAMLVELYEPILFRRLNAANPDVRRNALELFFDAFPLRDPEESNEVSDARMTAQFAALSAALKDDVPAVRAVAISGVGRILGAYWELIPAAVTAGYVKMLAAELAFDGASPAVRAAVTETLSTLVDLPLAHPLLAVVLPKLAPQLYDPSSKVRIAFVELLLSVRGLKNLQWQSIVDVQKLLEAMAADVPSVSTRIQQLLLPSFFPDAQMGPSLVAALLRSSPTAGKAFCLYLAGAHMPSTGGVAAAQVTHSGPVVAHHCLVTLVKDLTTHLQEVPLMSEDELQLAAAAGASKGGRAKKTRSKRRKGSKNDDEKDDVEGQQQEEDVPVSDTVESWESILGGLTAVVSGLAAHVTAKTLDPASIKGLFPSDTLSKLLDRCCSATARGNVVAIAAAVPQTPGAADIRGACMSLLAAPQICNASNPLAETRSALECVTSHPASRAALIKAFATAFGADADEVCPTLDEDAEEAVQRGKRRKFERHDIPLLTQASAMGYLACILELDGPRNFLLSSGILSRLLPLIGTALGCRVEELSTAIILDKSTTATTTVEIDGGTSNAKQAMLTYLKASLHLLLLSSGGSGGGGLPEEGQTEGNSAERGQAMDCLNQAVQWSTQLLVRLGDAAALSNEDLTTAVAPLHAPVHHDTQPAKKRTKAAKKKGAAAPAAAPSASPQSAAIKEAFATVQTCVAVAGEVARLKAFELSGDDASVTWASEAARMAQLFVGVIHRLHSSFSSSSSNINDEDVSSTLHAVIISGVSYAARLARNLAAAVATAHVSETTTDAAGGGCRDLQSELADAAAGEGDGVVPAATFDVLNPVLPFIEALMMLLCEDEDGSVVAATRPHFAGLVAAVCSISDSGCDNSGWLMPIVALLATGVNVKVGGEKDEILDDGHDENKGAVSTGKRGKRMQNASSELVSTARDAPVVQQLVAAAKLVGQCESIAGVAAVLASRAASRGDAVLALRGVELTQLMGFQGVTVRGKSRAGNSFVQVIDELKALQESFSSLLENHEEEYEEEGSGNAKALLMAKLQALLPPAPRVTFDEIFN